jgi:hypothetical protein
MMAHPNDRDEKLADDVAQRSGPQREECLQCCFGWRLEVGHHDRNDDRKDRIGECCQRSGVVFLFDTAPPYCAW